MKILKLLPFVTLVFALLSCSSDNEINRISIEGDLFRRTSYVLESGVDANGDGVFSHDLLEEVDCIGDRLQFNEDQRVFNPAFSFLTLFVGDDGAGNLNQGIGCSHGDGTFPTYKLNGNKVEFWYVDELQFVGELSNDSNTLTFNFPNELLYALHFGSGESDNILQEDGTILEYQGGAIVTYTKQ